MVWPKDISLETLPVLDTQGACRCTFRPARVQVPHSTREKGKLGETPNPEQEFNQIKSDE